MEFNKFFNSFVLLCLTIGLTLPPQSVLASSPDRTEDSIYVEQALSDPWITTKVRSALLFNFDSKAESISTSTNNGVVTLRGKVNDIIIKDALERIVSEVEGVRKVKNELSIKRSL